MRSQSIERRVSNGRTYDVRREAGATCLYANGVLHTAYDENAVISGRVWDLLALPGIVVRPSRALVLGVGGGAVIRQLLRFAAPSRVDGVDLDAVHLELGVRHFGLSDPRITLHHDDARAFVERAGATYDFMLDDVFGEVDREPQRAFPFDAAWADSLFARLSPRGVLVVNHATRGEVREGLLANPAFLARFASALTLTTSTASNVVVALFRTEVAPRSLRPLARAALGDVADRLDVEIRTLRAGS